MNRGTTHDFEVMLDDVDMTSVSVLWVTFAQAGREVLTKELEDLTVEDNRLIVHLTQEDTLAFRDRLPVYVQIRLKTNEDKAYVTDILKTSVGEVLKGGVI